MGGERWEVVEGGSRGEERELGGASNAIPSNVAEAGIDRTGR